MQKNTRNVYKINSTLLLNETITFLHLDLRRFGIITRTSILRSLLRFSNERQCEVPLFREERRINLSMVLQEERRNDGDCLEN